jgi:hypothetical protein
MKLSKDLNDALEAVSKEVDGWPAWKRSVDAQDLKKTPEPRANKASQNNGPGGSRKTAHTARAAGA